MKFYIDNFSTDIIKSRFFRTNLKHISIKFSLFELNHAQVGPVIIDFNECRTTSTIAQFLYESSFIWPIVGNINLVVISELITVTNITHTSGNHFSLDLKQIWLLIKYNQIWLLIKCKQIEHFTFDQIRTNLSVEVLIEFKEIALLCFKYVLIWWFWPLCRTYSWHHGSECTSSPKHISFNQLNRQKQNFERNRLNATSWTSVSIVLYDKSFNATNTR